jgi:hypothetical protein
VPSQFFHVDHADPTLRKRIVRALIHEVIVDVGEVAAEVVLLIHWKGGVHSELRFARRRRGQSSAHTPPQTIDAVRALANICTDDLIASALNRSGLPRAEAIVGHVNALLLCALITTSRASTKNAARLRVG